jgi:hypothetical protein
MIDQPSIENSTLDPQPANNQPTPKVYLENVSFAYGDNISL